MYEQLILHHHRYGTAGHQGRILEKAQGLGCMADDFS